MGLALFVLHLDGALEQGGDGVAAGEDEVVELVLHLLDAHGQEFLALEGVGAQVVAVARDEHVDRVEQVLHARPVEVADHVVLAAQVDDERRPRDFAVVVVGLPRAPLENVVCVQRLPLQMLKGFDREVV